MPKTAENPAPPLLFIRKKREYSRTSMDPGSVIFRARLHYRQKRPQNKRVRTKPFLDTLPRESPFCFRTKARNRKDVFTTMGYSEIRRIVIKCSKKAGLPHIKIHGFRHSCVSWLLSKGMSYRTVARWVGDTESVVLETYSHLVPDEKDQIANFLDEL